MDKVYIVGGLAGKAFPTYDLAEAYACTFKKKLSINAIDFVEDTKPVEEIKGCILFFNCEKKYDLKPYTFNTLDNKPEICLRQGYGTYSLRLFLPVAKNDLTEEIINNIMTFSIPFLRKNDFTCISLLDPKYLKYIDIIKTIITNCDDSFMAKIMLSFS